MFTRVLVAEDMDDINKGVVTKLSELDINKVQHVQYCDDAYFKIKKALQDENPFELLITDLSFKSDHREQKYPSGEALIDILKKEQPDLKIIVYSVEDRLQKVRFLVENYGINAYVCKGRRGLSELSHAISLVHDNRLYLSPQIDHAMHPQTNLEIDDYDLLLLKQLSVGLSQTEISTYFKNNNLSPNSLSSIEKRVNLLKIEFKASNAVHLISKVKDLGLI